MEVFVYGPLRGVTGEAHLEVSFEGGTVAEAVDAVLKAYPGMERHLLDDDGSIAPGVRVAIDGERKALDDACPADAQVTLHPVLTGG